MKRESEELHNGTTVKRRKGSRLQIWDLPVGILSDIISRQPLQDAIRTSVLSSQCKNMWCHYTNLIFDCYTLRSGYAGRPINIPDFIAKLDAVLEQHSGVGVKVMEVRHSFLRNTHADHIDRWVEFAVQSKTKEISLHLSYVGAPVSTADAYNFPCHLFHGSNGSYVQCLQITSVSLKLPLDMNGFLSLRKLSLVDVSITEEHVEYSLSRCNLLEFLEIAYCGTITCIRALHPINRLKHLVVNNCILLQRVEVNCCLTTLVYAGPVVPLEFAAVSRLRDVGIDLSPAGSTVLDYITTGFPSTLPHLETVTLRCQEHKRAMFPVRPIKFMYLRHLRLEAIISNKDHTKIDVLDYAHLLNAAPFMEKLELHMWMRSHKPYVAEHGELRSLASQSGQHTHLRSAYFTGFFGSKHQVELALHILHASAVLELMEIDPAVKIIPGGPHAVPKSYEGRHYIDGRMVATNFVCKEDHDNVVQVVEASQEWRL